MALLTVRQAALQVGISRQTMFRKIKEGTVSATTARNGQLQVDTSELLRVFGELQPATVSKATGGDDSGLSRKSGATGATVAQQIEIERLRAQLELRTAELGMTRSQLEEARAREQEARQDRERLVAIIERQTLLLSGPPPAPPKKKAITKKGGGKKAASKKQADTPAGGGAFWPFWMPR